MVVFKYIINRKEWSLKLKRICVVLLLIAVIFSSLPVMSGCGAAVEDFPVEAGGVLIEEAPKRVICLSNSFLEIVFGLRYNAQIAGRAFDCKLQEAQEIAVCGTAASPAIEAILGMENIDLLITDTTTPQEELDKLKEAKIKCMVLDNADSRASLEKLYKTLGSVFAGNAAGAERAQEYFLELFVQLDDIARMVSKDESYSVCIVMDNSLEKCATGDTLVNNLIELAGGFNVAVQSSGWAFNTSDIAAADPEIILAPASAISRINGKREIQGTAAMINQAVYEFDTTIFDCQGESILAATWRIAHLLHPTIVTKEVVPPKYYYEVEEPNYVMTREEYDEYLRQQEEAENGEDEE